MEGEKSRAGSSPNRVDVSRIVVGIDGSEQSLRALHWAASLAQATDASVTAVAVWHVPVQFGAPAMIAPAVNFEEEARQWIREAVLELTEGEAARVEPLVSGGNIAEVLLSQSTDADLMVLGNKGRGAFASALIGSVALRCAHHATCPVVLVP